MNKCKNCTFRNPDGFCGHEKIRELWGGDYMSEKEKEKYKDFLIYGYDEGGSFWVGPEFGCVHFEQ